MLIGVVWWRETVGTTVRTWKTTSPTVTVFVWLERPGCGSLTPDPWLAVMGTSGDVCISGFIKVYKGPAAAAVTPVTSAPLWSLKSLTTQVYFSEGAFANLSRYLHVLLIPRSCMKSTNKAQPYQMQQRGKSDQEILSASADEYVDRNQIVAGDAPVRGFLSWHQRWSPSSVSAETLVGL